MYKRQVHAADGAGIHPQGGGRAEQEACGNVHLAIQPGVHFFRSQGFYIASIEISGGSQLFRGRVARELNLGQVAVHVPLGGRPAGAKHHVMGAVLHLGLVPGDFPQARL